MGPARLPLRVIGVIGFAVAIGLAAAMLVPVVFGFHRYVITGDSMEGTYDRGSLVFEREVPVSELRAGDVITYDPPPGVAPSGLVTHRIFAIRDGAHGRILRTKGDANDVVDPWKFRLDRGTQPRVTFQLPYVGYAFAALSVRWIRSVLIGIPALLIAFILFAGLWRDAGSGEPGIARLAPRSGNGA
jgi:signal peptidase I